MKRRVQIGKHFDEQPDWKIRLGVLLVYIPLLITIPFVAIGILFVKGHLRLIGAKGVQPFSDFLPRWASHRYNYDHQITHGDEKKWTNLRSYRFYWIFNCKIYCPLSVALFRYMAYLVRIVENWWCPFEHEKKEAYKCSSIDYSYWHIYEKERSKLHEDDREYPIWNEEAQDKEKNPLS